MLKKNNVILILYITLIRQKLEYNLYVIKKVADNISGSCERSEREQTL